MIKRLFEVLRPKVPVVWLDTHAIRDLAYSIYDDGKSADWNLKLSIYRKFVELRKSSKILCFESDQLTEIEARPELMDNAMTVLTYVSQGLATHYECPRQAQMQIAMEAYLNQSKEIKIEWSSAFRGNPFERQDTSGFFIRARFDPNSEDIKKEKELNQLLSSKLEVLRSQRQEEGRGLHLRARRQIQYEKEILSKRDVFLEIYKRTTNKTLRGERLTEEDLNLAKELLMKPLLCWQAVGGQDDITGLSKFYASPYCSGLPFIHIDSLISAHKIVSPERIKPSDVMDIHNISSFLPYCTHMVLDRAMKEAVSSCGLDAYYGVRILTLLELGEELDQFTN